MQDKRALAKESSTSSSTSAAGPRVLHLALGDMRSYNQLNTLIEEHDVVVVIKQDFAPSTSNTACAPLTHAG